MTPEGKEHPENFEIEIDREGVFRYFCATYRRFYLFLLAILSGIIALPLVGETIDAYEPKNTLLWERLATTASVILMTAV
ncbi:MAG: hypothetical protein AAGA58_02870, partial [Verrucomicrobiota bacterium]